MKQCAPEDGALGGEHELERLARRRRLDGGGVACRRRPRGSALLRQEADGAAQQRLQEGCLILNQPKVIVNTAACALSPKSAAQRCSRQMHVRSDLARQWLGNAQPYTCGSAAAGKTRKAAGESSGSGNGHPNTITTRNDKDHTPGAAAGRAAPLRARPGRLPATAAAAGRATPAARTAPASRRSRPPLRWAAAPRRPVAAGAASAASAAAAAAAGSWSGGCSHNEGVVCNCVHKQAQLEGMLPPESRCLRHPEGRV